MPDHKVQAEDHHHNPLNYEGSSGAVRILNKGNRRNAGLWPIAKRAVQQPIRDFPVEHRFELAAGV